MTWSGCCKSLTNIADRNRKHVVSRLRLFSTRWFRQDRSNTQFPDAALVSWCAPRVAEIAAWDAAYAGTSFDRRSAGNRGTPAVPTVSTAANSGCDKLELNHHSSVPRTNGRLRRIRTARDTCESGWPNFFASRDTPLQVMIGKEPFGLPKLTNFGQTQFWMRIRDSFHSRHRNPYTTWAQRLRIGTTGRLV